jgi:hypothetical protein
VTSNTHDPATNATSGATAACEAALIATFYCRRDRALTRSLHEGLYRSLAGTSETVDIPGDWHDRDNDAYLRCFGPPAAYDTTVIQLALNAPGNAASAWECLRQRLEHLLDAAHLAHLLDGDQCTDLWGYTLTYQAVLVPGIGADRVLKKLQPTVRRLRSSESLQPLAQAKISGGKVWLMDIPTEGDGLEAATVYVGLSPPGKEEAFVKAIYGPGAALLMPDLIAHKGYHHMRQYRGGDLQSELEVSLANLQQTTNRLLMSNSDQSVETEDGLQDLARAYPRLMPVISILKELHISLVRQSRNYNQWQAQMKGNDVIGYHRGHLEMAISELELLVTQFQDATDAANTAVSIAQVRVDKALANRQWWIATLLGVVGLAVSLRGILAWEGVEELLGQIPMLAPYSGNFFVQLGTQIGIVLVCALLLVLVASWIRKRGRKRRVSERE